MITKKAVRDEHRGVRKWAAKALKEMGE